MFLFLPFHPTANRGRSTSFKKTVDTSDGRRVREQTTLHIRKQKKDEQLRKKRFKSDVQMMDENNNVPSSTLIMHDGKSPTAEDIPQLANIVMGDNPQEEKFDAMVFLRRLLSKERNPPVDTFLATGALPHIIRGLTVGFNDHSLALESERILGYISHRHTAEVLGAGGAAPLVQLLNSDCIAVREEAIWCLGNLAGENAEARDMVLAQNPIPFL
jgi:importin subunit alpha-6/7